MTKIVLLVLSSILLILVLGLILNKNFRNDILKGGGENEAEIKGFKVKGTLFWVLYASTAAGTIYLATKLDPNIEGSSIFDPVTPKLGTVTKLIPLKNQPWTAVNTITGEPVQLIYGVNEVLDTFENKEHLDLELKLNRTFEILNKKDQRVGKINKTDVGNIDLSNILMAKNAFEIYYDLQLHPFNAIRNHSLSNWTEYEKLPFTIEPHYSHSIGTHIQIKTLEGEEIEKISVDNKKVIVVRENKEYFLINLRSRSMKPGSAHVNFSIVPIGAR